MDDSAAAAAGSADADGGDAELASFTEPLIHMFNKNQSVVPPTELRKHILLLGDGIGDVAMADGAGECSTHGVAWSLAHPFIAMDG
jgi:phosphoglycolate phosphatase-like HAD superfamily hydrolase